ncbi:transposase-like protein, partial [Anoxybacillus voinovskiensis]
MSKKQRTYKSYSSELKLEAVQRALAGESVKVIAHHLEITDPDYIYKWIDQYEMYGEVGLKRKVRNHPEMDKDFIIRAFCDVGFFQKKWYHSIIFFLCSSADSSYI